MNTKDQIAKAAQTEEFVEFEVLSFDPTTDTLRCGQTSESVDANMFDCDDFTISAESMTHFLHYDREDMVGRRFVMIALK